MSLWIRDMDSKVCEKAGVLCKMIYRFYRYGSEIWTLRQMIQTEGVLLQKSEDIFIDQRYGL